MPYSLLLDQIVYTSFADTGFKTVASPQVTAEIQEAFIERVVHKHWNANNPSRIQSVYLHQIAPAQILFGWLYNDGAQRDGNDVPLFICYYLAEPLLFYFQLEKIFSCLHRGPISQVDRHVSPASLEAIVVRNYWNYQSVRPGLAVDAIARSRSHLALKQGELLDIFVSANEQETLAELCADSVEQQIANLSIYTRYLVKTVEAGEVNLNGNAEIIKAKAMQPYQGYKEKLRQYQQAFLEAIKGDSPLQQHTDNLKRLQQDLQLRKEDVEQIEAFSLKGSQLNNFDDKQKRNSVLQLYKSSRLLLMAGVAFAFLVLFGSIYKMAKPTLVAPHQPELGTVELGTKK